MPPTHRIRRPHPHPVRRGLSFPLKAAFVAIGVIGLAGLALALLGPERIEREVLEPLREAALPRAEKLWADSRHWRARIAGLFAAAGEERAQLVQDFHDWIDGFRAT